MRLDHLCIYILLLGIVLLFLVMLPLVMYGISKSNENKDNFCISKAMEHKYMNNIDYCMDNYQDKLYIIISKSYDSCLFLKRCIETDFKIIKEVVTLE